MKRVVLINFVLFLTSYSALADLYGGYLSYKVLQNDSVEISLYLIRNCNGIPFNQLQSVNISQGSISQTVSLSKKSSRDLTAACSPMYSRCATTNSGYYGFEENYFSQIVSTSAYSTTAPIKIKYSDCCISGSITNLVLQSSTNIYLDATFYKGYTLNEGPQFKRAFPVIFLTGVPNYYNAAINNTYGDSIVYDLVAPYATENQSHAYSANYTADRPFQYSGSTAYHLSFDPISRQLSTGSTPFVVPTTQQMPMLSYVISRYRNGVLIGSVRVAHTIFMAPNTSSNQTPAIQVSSGSYKVCAGNQLCINLYSSDANAGDSTYLFMDNSLTSGVNFTTNYSNKHASGTFCWVPSLSHVRNEPYFFTFRVRDNSCPKTLESYATIAIKVDSVGGIVQATTNASFNFCTSKVDFTTQVTNGGTASYQYNWWGSNGLNAGASAFSYTYPGAGWKYYSVRISSPNSCGDYLKNDSVFVPQFSPLKVSVFDKSDTITCSGTPFVLLPTSRGGLAPVKYYWNNSSSSANSFTFQSTSPDTVFLRAVDSNGCESRTSIFIRIRQNPSPAIAGGDKVLCTNVLGVSLTASPAGGTWSGSSCVNNFQRLFIPQASCVGQNEVIYTLTDNYGCIGRDTVLYTVTDKLKSNAGTYTPVCATTGFVQLYGTPAGGTWFGDSVRLNKFYPSQFKVGQNLLIYRSPLSCSEDDTTYLEVLSAPPVTIQVPDSFCGNINSITLNATPVGGSWFGNHILNNKFNVQTAGAGKHEIAYYYYSASGCLTSNSKWITVQPTPVVSAGSDITICKNSGLINLTATPVGGEWSGHFVSLGKFNSDSAIGGNYSAIYQYVNGVCSLKDTLAIKLLEANFDASVFSGNAPLAVNFNNTSTAGFDYYSWVFGDPASGVDNISSAPNPMHTYHRQGVYTVKLTAGYSATSCTHAVTKNAYIAVGPNGHYSPVLLSGLTVFPNPSNQPTVTVLYDRAGTQDHYLLEVFNMAGVRVQLHQLQYNSSEQLSLPTQGIYFLRATCSDGSIQVKKVQVLR